MASLSADGNSFANAHAITAHDSNNFACGIASAIYVGGAGTVPAVLENGSVVTFTAVAGGILPIRAKRVNTGGTATAMVALY